MSPAKATALTMSFTRRERVFLFALWAVATALNLTKAFHIDDPFHLAVAQWITDHPLRPLSGLINWGGVEAPFHHGNHPPLFFFGMAAWGSVFGFGEVAMHAFMSLFTGLALVMFHRLAKLLVPTVALWATGLLALSPGFLVNQNMMLDMPLLSMVLAFLYHGCISIRDPESRHALWAACFLTAGALMKYTALALFPVLLLVLWYGGRRRYWITAVPALAFVLWSVWNVQEFGYVHVLGRDTEPPGGDPLDVRLLSWVMTLGSIAPCLFVLALHRLPIRQRLVHWIAAILLFGLAAFVLLAFLGVVDGSLSDGVLLIFFMANGALGISAAFGSRRTADGPDDRSRMRAVLWCAFLLLGLFVVLFAPWMATRHLLLLVPLLLLLAAPSLDRMSASLRGALLMTTGAMGVLLAISDRHFAAFYAEQAEALAKVEGPPTKWYTGSFGWGWYAAKAGLRNIADAQGGFMPGDIIVAPMNFASPSPPESVRTREVLVLEQPLVAADAFSTRHWVRFYSARYPDLPWHISRTERERLQLVVVAP